MFKLPESDVAKILEEYKTIEEYVKATSVPDRKYLESFVQGWHAPMFYESTLFHLDDWWTWFECSEYMDLSPENIVGNMEGPQWLKTSLQTALGSLTADQRSLFLKFATGEPRIQVESPLEIRLDNRSSMPSAKTCLPELYLPATLESLSEEERIRELKSLFRVMFTVDELSQR
jgi:hypothetical protein